MADPGDTDNRTAADDTEQHRFTSPAEDAEIDRSDVDSDMDSDDDTDRSDESDTSEATRSAKSHILDYERCTVAELESFVNERCTTFDKRCIAEYDLEEPSLECLTHKFLYIRALTKADREWRFRFMDLPAEMRTLIYGELLLFDLPYCTYDTVGSAHPAILMANRQVHEEAKGVLYDTNVFVTSFDVTADNDAELEKVAHVHKDIVVAKCAHAKFFRIPQAVGHYPEWFKRIAQLEIRVQYAVAGDSTALADGYWPLNHYLYGLASFLMDGHRLKRLNLKLEILPGDAEFSHETVFFPLRRLRNIPEVSITGDFPHVIVNKLKEDLSSNEPQFNTMRHWKLLQDAAHAQLDLLTTIDGVNCGHCSISPRMETLLECLDRLHSEEMESCFTSRLEENFIARLALLRDAVNEMDLDDLQTLLKVAMSKQKSVKQYNAVTDEGRLDEALDIWNGQLYDEDAKYSSDHDWSEDEEIEIGERSLLRQGSEGQASSEPSSQQGPPEDAPADQDEMDISGEHDMYAPTASRPSPEL